MPVAIIADSLALDSELDPADVIDGVLQDPTGPFVVAWYRNLGMLGPSGNVVLAGHVDYYNLGDAVFARLREPGAVVGDQMTLIGEDGRRYRYEVQRSRTYATADLTPEVVARQITGATRTPTLTLITCGGDVDPVSGEYLSRIAVRCTRVQVLQADA